MSNQREMPKNIDSEIALLGTIIMHPEAMRTCYDSSLYVEHFYRKEHKTIYETMCELYDERVETNMVNVKTRLADKKQLKEIGDSEYLLNLTLGVVAFESAKHYIKNIQTKYDLRELIKASEATIEDCLNRSHESEMIMDAAESRLLKITHGRRTGDFQNIKDTVTTVMKKTQDLADGKIAGDGIKTNFKSLDNVTNGFQKGDLIILAARPATGKTAFALNLVVNAAAVSKKPVAMFSLEMASDILTVRMLGIKSLVSIYDISHGRLNSANQWNALNETSSKLKKLPVYIEDSSFLRVSELFSKCRKLKEEKGDLGLVVVDYLQLLAGSKNTESRLQEVSEISRNLKGLARELEVPVIALSQLSRAVEQRGGEQGGTPRLSDLRESGSIEQDADIVMFLSKDPETSETEEPNILVDIAKHRNGATAQFLMAFKRNTNTFMDIENRY